MNIVKMKKVTIGMDNSAHLLVVVHTYQEIDKNVSRIRIISAQKAQKNEISVYLICRAVITFAVIEEIFQHNFKGSCQKGGRL